MTNDQKLIITKLIHTIIWVFYNIVIGYLLYAVLSDNIDIWVWIGFGLIAIEGLVLLMFNNICPVTIIARRYSASRMDNFDIFLPNCLAKNNKRIYSAIVLIILCILIYRLSS